MQKLLLIIVLISISLVSCTRQPEFEQFHEMKNNIWNRLEVYAFEVPVTSTTSSYDFYLAVYLDSTFSQNKVSVNFTMTDDFGEFRSKDYNYRLINPYGRLLLIPYENGFLLKRQLKNDFTFNKKGMSHIEIRNTMDKYEVMGVKKLGLVIEKHK